MKIKAKYFIDGREGEIEINGDKIYDMVSAEIRKDEYVFNNLNIYSLEAC